MIECSREREAIRAWAEPRPTANGDLIEAMSLFYVFRARTCQLQQHTPGGRGPQERLWRNSSP